MYYLQKSLALRGKFSFNHHLRRETFFEHKSKSIGLRLFKLFTFLTYTCPRLWAKSGVFSTYCLSP